MEVWYKRLICEPVQRKLQWAVSKTS